MSTVLRANTELVAVAWLGSLTGLSPAMVATQLPRDTDAWKTTGFITVRTIGGTMALYTPLRSPVLAVDAWAVNPGSNKPPWFQANALMETVRDGAMTQVGHAWLTLPGDYEQARVTAAYFTNEPQRVYTDPGAYARYTASLTLHWVGAT